jgi:long-chain acyl-CoA synthetase
MRNLFELYVSLRQKHGNQRLFCAENLSYHQAITFALRRAQFLIEQGFKPGDIVAVLGHNSAEWGITYMAITAMGGIALLLDTNLTHELYQKYLALVETKAIFVSNKFSHHYHDVITFDIALTGGLAEKELAANDCTRQSLSTMLYTSGTVGDPKIIGLNHNNIIETGLVSVAHITTGPRDIFLSLLPLYHVYGLIAGFIAPLFGGSSIVVQQSLKGTDIIQSLADYPITIFPAVPQIWELFIERILGKLRKESSLKHNIFLFVLNHTPSFYHLGLGFIPKLLFKPVHTAIGTNIRYLLTGGARMKRKYWLYYQNMGFTLLEGYGLTETTGPMCGSRVKKPKPICIGRPFPGNEIQIRQTDNGLGEIWVRGVSVMPGYYKNDKLNQEVFDRDGWFNTGDIGFIDRDGDVHLRGRKKNVIVLDSGKNAYPEELESFYLSNSLAIEEISIFGRRVEGKEVIFAVIVPINKERNAYVEIKEELRRIDQGLPTYKRIGEFAISYEPLPRTSTKKVIVREVVKNLEAQQYQVQLNDPHITIVKKTAPELVGAHR